MDVQICQWVPEEIPFARLSEVLAAAHDGSREVEYNTTGLTEAELTERMARGGATFIALSGRAVVGMTAVCLENWKQWYCPGKTAALRFIAVRPECAGRGVASRLVAACAQWAESRGVGTLLWTTAANNRAAVATAEKNGFVRVDYFRFRGIGHPSVRLARWLGAKAPGALKRRAYYALKKGYVSLFRKG